MSNIENVKEVEKKDEEPKHMEIPNHSTGKMTGDVNHLEMQNHSKRKMTGDVNLSELIVQERKKKKENACAIIKTTRDITLRLLGVLLTLYLFIIVLDLMSTGFRICLGLQISQLFRSEAILQSPITGLVIGVIVTVVVQSSSASTSIVVSLVASGAIPEIKYAIPIIMGANMGTSVTSTLVALTQAKDKHSFGRAFAGGTVHDAFNLLCVLVLLPLEVASGYLEHLSEAMVSSLDSNSSSTLDSNQFDIFDKIKKPITDAIIMIDKSLMDKYADKDYVIMGNETFLKKTCTDKLPNGTIYKHPCRYFFGSDLFEFWSENTIGIVLAAVSLILVILSLFFISKLLGAIFRGPVAKVIQKVVNAEPKHCITRHLIGYFSIAIGCVLTMILQSSSVFTSSLVPLVGLGIVSLERVFPLTLGSNIGTTFTGIIAALGQSSNFKQSIQIAIVHTFFNVTGIIIWYPIPFLRSAPLAIARYLGERSSHNRSFAVGYLIVVFLITPGVLFGLAIISEIVLYSVFGVFVLIVLILVAFHFVQKKFPEKLPKKFRTWEFLPHLIYDVLCFVPPPSVSSDIEKNEIDDAEKSINEKPKKSLVSLGNRVAPLELDDKNQ